VTNSSATSLNVPHDKRTFLQNGDSALHSARDGEIDRKSEMGAQEKAAGSPEAKRGSRARREAKVFTLLGFFILFTLRNLNELNSITQIKRRMGGSRKSAEIFALGPMSARAR
jgi:hypothetical protein